jgi:hypothetical protein
MHICNADYIVTCYRIVAIGRGLDWMTGFITLIHLASNYKRYCVIANLHTLQFTVTHTLGFSVFTSRNLATDFNTNYTNLTVTEAHIKSSLHSVIILLLSLLNHSAGISRNFLNYNLSQSHIATDD